MKTIGIVGGIGPESTIDYYRSIIMLYRARKNDGHYPHIIIDSVDLTEMLGLLESGKLEELTESLCKAIERLAGAGAEFAVFASNTPHLLFDNIKLLSPIPLLSIVEETCEKAKAMGLEKVGLFGTRFTMQGGFYQKVFKRNGITISVPESEEQAYIHYKYMNELVAGRVVVEDIALQGDRLSSLSDGVEHRGEGLVAIDQRLDSIAPHHWSADQPVDQATHSRKTVAPPLELQANRVGRRRSRRSLAEDRHGATMNAVHAQHGVCDGAKEGRDPDDAHPTDGGTYVPLVEDHVNRAGHSDQQRHGAEHVGPGLCRQGQDEA